MVAMQMPPTPEQSGFYSSLLLELGASFQYGGKAICAREPESRSAHGWRASCRRAWRARSRATHVVAMPIFKSHHQDFTPRMRRRAGSPGVPASGFTGTVYCQPSTARAHSSDALRFPIANPPCWASCPC
ncbi:TniB family NTP-binding protein [Cupriavidus yeoncheonensis]|nr:TniB family NTP-binding protein [Cupriavidus yeoncheonensis]